MALHVLGCTCSDFTGRRNGFGQCKKRDPVLGDLFICYVNLPSTCTDLRRSGTYPEKSVSAEACFTKNRAIPGNATLLSKYLYQISSIKLRRINNFIVMLALPIYKY